MGRFSGVTAVNYISFIIVMFHHCELVKELKEIGLKVNKNSNKTKGVLDSEYSRRNLLYLQITWLYTIILL